MPSASFCFLLTFCFRKVVKEIFSKSPKIHGGQFLSGTKTEPKNQPEGGHQSRGRLEGAGGPHAAPSTSLPDLAHLSGSLFSYLLPFDLKT